MLELNDKVTFKGNKMTLLGDEVKVGDRAKNFTALSSSLQEVKLEEYFGKVIILSMFPSIDTGVCALQTVRFNKEAENLGDDVQIITLSLDLPFALKRFCAAENINNAITLSDHRDLDFGLKYGFVIKELRLLSRGVIVIDKDGIVRHVEYVKENTNHPDYDRAIAVAKECL